jgi:hypothetical protein
MLFSFEHALPVHAAAARIHSATGSEESATWAA